MTDASLVADWPGRPAFALARVTADEATIIASAGDLAAVRPWASVSKLALALAALRSVDRGDWSLDDPCGPPGATLAHLLSHASGLGFEIDDRVVPVGTRRVYSNTGMDLVAAAVSGGEPVSWLRGEVLKPLGLTVPVEDRVCAGVHGSVHDLLRLGRELLHPTLVSAPIAQAMTTPFLPALEGITPPFGRQTPNWWGLGPELKGEKQHWMGQWPAASFGHFGRSGALLLCDPTTNLVLAVTSSEPFGPWAVAAWPTWVTVVRGMAT
jgi:CubicO group peptidase (beta-lactamase class C family)